MISEKNQISPINILEIPGEAISTNNGFKRIFKIQKSFLITIYANKNIKNFLNKNITLLTNNQFLLKSLAVLVGHKNVLNITLQNIRFKLKII